MRRGSVAGVLLLLVALQGCFTAGVWGYGLDTEEDRSTGRTETVVEPLGEGEVVESLWFRLLATPFALALDCPTLPVQAFLFGWDDEDPDPAPRRPEDGWRSTHRDRND
jgi:hypothetical protein